MRIPYCERRAGWELSDARSRFDEAMVDDHMGRQSNWATRSRGRLRDLAFLVFVVGMSVALLTFAFGTKAPSGFRLSNCRRMPDESFAGLVAAQLTRQIGGRGYHPSGVGRGSRHWIPFFGPATMLVTQTGRLSSPRHEDF